MESLDANSEITMQNREQRQKTFAPQSQIYNTDFLLGDKRLPVFQAFLLAVWALNPTRATERSIASPEYGSQQGKRHGGVLLGHSYRRQDINNPRPLKATSVIRHDGGASLPAATDKIK